MARSYEQTSDAQGSAYPALENPVGTSPLRLAANDFTGHPSSSPPLYSEREVGTGTEWISRSERNRRLLYTSVGSAGLITLWGLLNWEYGTASFNQENEGWFANNTTYGGVDKLGHMYACYVTAHAMTSLYRHWQFEPQDALFYGALTSWFVLGYMEFGDAFSNHGFSYEDLTFNTIGTILGYYTYRYPSLAEKLDFRMEYGFSPQKSDVFTDYENHRFLFALKLNGFEPFRQTWLRHLELHLGYYARGFADKVSFRERKLYAGIGINLTDLFTRHGHKKTGTFLRYVQIPYTYYKESHDLN